MASPLLSDPSAAADVSVRLLAWFTAATLLNRVLLSLQYSFTSYSLFVNLWWTLLQCPLFWILTLWRQRSIPLSKAELSIPWHVWWVLAFITALDNILTGISASHLTSFGAVQVLLSQARIPISMAVCKWLVPGTAYSASQYIGAFIVLCGICTTLLPDVIKQAGGSGSSDFSDALPWMGVYILHCIPNALIFVYQERVLKSTEGSVDDYYFNAKVQFPTLIATLVMLVPGAALDGIAPDSLSDNLSRGASCEFGITPNSEKNSCTFAPLFTHAFIIVNTLWNVMVIPVLASAGANVNFLISTFTLPLAACVFALPFMPNNKPVTVWTFLGMLLITSGLLIYKFGIELCEILLRRCDGLQNWLASVMNPRPLPLFWRGDSGAYQAVPTEK